MTTGKPPHPPQKTLLGMPSEVQEALKKLQAQKDQQALQQRTQLNPPSAPPQPSAAQGNLDRTLYGNPHDSNAPAPPRSNAPRPDLPREQAFQPPVRGAAPQQPRPQVPSGHGIAGPRRTAVGTPSDIAAASQHLQARAPAAAPNPQAAQSNRAAQSPAASWPPAAEAASPWVKPQAGQPQTSAAPQPTAAIAQATQVRQTAVAQAAQPAQAPQPPQPTASRSGVVQRGVTAASVPPPLTPRPSNNATAADRERTPAPNASASAAPSRPETGSKSVNPPANPATGQANGLLATRLVTFEPGALVASSPSRTSLPEISAPSLNPVDQGAPVRSAPVRRWPALSLLGLAFVAFGGVVVVRAPGLLPAPLAALIAPPHPPAPQPDTTSPPPPPSAANDQASPAPPAAESAAAAAPVAAATDVPPTAAQPEAPAQPAAATAAPPQAMQGSSAELEKQAIDLLLANDYAAARAVYERLKVAEPARAEYGIMLDLLTRELSPACGGPGQVPCENR